VIVPTVGRARVERLLDSLSEGARPHETIVVDNGTGAAELDEAVAGLDGGRVMRLDSNLGFSRAVNLAAAEAEGETLVLLNDDSVVDAGFVASLIGGLDPSAGIVMAAGVMRDAADPGLIETAGIELDRTLMAFDYLNGEPVGILEGEVPDPIGPSGAAAAIDRSAFRDVGGFDENLFAYLEDVDLVLRMRTEGGRCLLAPGARGTHEHSATLGSGSRRKNYLMGFGRGYLLRRWGVLSSPRRLAQAAFEDATICVGQAIIDRNVEGIRGRWQGLRAATPAGGFPAAALAGGVVPPGMLSERLRRRRRRRRQAKEGLTTTRPPLPP
jgi:N-acetylglucosaminyl-diphospho-decaprenol L-rhamnosyltransferase